MSECKMTLRGANKRDKLTRKHLSVVSAAYEPYFLEELDPAIPWLAKNKTKVSINAGTSDVEGLGTKVAYVDGDDCTDANIQDRGFEPICAQCYLDGAGMTPDVCSGADIVVCGRVAAASPTVGAAMWWQGWTREDNLQELATALMVGHVIECSTYATGGYYHGFKDLGVKDVDMGCPIAAIEATGEPTFKMEKLGMHGLVNKATIASQLLYEIQGLYYDSSDVAAQIKSVKLELVGITPRGLFQAEFHFYLTGLDIEEKAKMIERHTLEAMGKHVKKFTGLKLQICGTVPEDPQSQNLLQAYRGSTMAPDMRCAMGRPFFECWVSLTPREFVKEQAHLPDGTVVDIRSPSLIQHPQPCRSFILWSHYSRPLDLGLFVRHDDEYDWLRTFNATSGFDGLGKNICEYVDLPSKFLERGRV
ncbi:DUF1446-domain-containing protein [Byssothecium circinans]|uniref:DUF1446-domain-containing protein n=1 Tax=Byssothecium circinans TaxID=147558 RepID=A0A6A5TJ09_9PLEO|nr:DUF1446-domain-containing protein [Byssothecium circinans]